MARFVASHSLNFLLIMSNFLGSASCQEQERRPSRYLIPEGYVGWLRIEFNVEGAPPIPIEDGHYLFKFPPSGLIKTSSDIEYGWAMDEYYYSSGDDRRRLKGSDWGGGGMIWGGVTGSKQVPQRERTRYAEFFVGTEEQFKNCGLEYKDSDLNPVIGPMNQRCNERTVENNQEGHQR